MLRNVLQGKAMKFEGKKHKDKINNEFRIRATRLKNQMAKKTGKSISYARIAEDSNLEYAVIKRVMGGERGATLVEAYGIAKALGTTVSYLSATKEHSQLKTSYSNLLKILTDRRDQVLREMEILEDKLTLIDVQLAISEDVLQFEK